MYRTVFRVGNWALRPQAEAFNKDAHGQKECRK